jgi:hypothetical protein
LRVFLCEFNVNCECEWKGLFKRIKQKQRRGTGVSRMSKCWIEMSQRIINIIIYKISMWIRPLNESSFFVEWFVHTLTKSFVCCLLLVRRTSPIKKFFSVISSLTYSFNLKGKYSLFDLHKRFFLFVIRLHDFLLANEHCVTVSTCILFYYSSSSHFS